MSGRALAGSEGSWECQTVDPLVFEPYFRPQVWGGRRLERCLGKPLPAAGSFGESWELSAHALHVSRVADGPLQGNLLTELWESRGAELFGREPPPPQFPLLVKLLDCHGLLSVQVHPDDQTARDLLGEPWGKTEAWVVLETEPQARIYAGLRAGTTPEDVDRHLDAGTLADCLNWFTPKPGDCVLLSAGTVHAAGGGLLMAEVQQSSDATFRLFDWNRLGTDGKARPLHRREARQSIHWPAAPVGPVEAAPAIELPGANRSQQFVHCPYFVLDRFWLAGPLEMAFGRRLSIWLVIEGAAELAVRATGYRRTLRRGETVLVPAAAEGLCWTPAADSGQTVLLSVRLP